MSSPQPQDPAQAQLLLMSTVIGPAAGLIGCSLMLLAFSIPIFCRKAVRPTLPRNTLTVYTCLRLIGYLLLGLATAIENSPFEMFASAFLVAGTPVLFYGALSSVRRWWLNLRATRVRHNAVFALAIVDTVAPFVLMTIEMFFFFASISGMGTSLQQALAVPLIGYLALAVLYITAVIYVTVAHSRPSNRKDAALILCLGLLLLPARIGSFFIAPAYVAPEPTDPGFQSYWVAYILAIAVPDILIAALLTIFAPNFSRMTLLDGASDNQSLIYKPQPWTMPSISEVDHPAPPPYETAGSYA